MQFSPRTLKPGETPPVGTLFFPRGHALVNRLTAFGEYMDYDAAGVELPWIPTHVYIITGEAVGGTHWHVTEALSKGVTSHFVAPRTDTHAVVPGDADFCKALAAAASGYASAGIRYDWVAIGRQAVRGVAGLFYLERQANWLLKRTFRNDNPKRMICSEVGARSIEAALGRPLCDLVPEWDVTPLDLWLFLTEERS